MIRLLALMVTLAACGRTPTLREPEPQGPQQPQEPQPPGATDIHARLAFAPSFDKPPFILPRREEAHGLLTLEVLADGRVQGTLALQGLDTSLTAVAGTLRAGHLTLDPGSAYVSPDTSVGWEHFSLDLVASRAGGPLDTGSGTATGQWMTAAGDVADSSQYAAVVSAQPDLIGESAHLDLKAIDYRDQVLPTDALQVKFLEPVAELDALHALRVLADEQEISGSFSSTPKFGRVTALDFRPSHPLPFGAALRVDLGTLLDPAGNRLAAATASLRVVADPGSVTQNLGFEQGLAGWVTLGRSAMVTGAFNGLAPPQGAAQLLVRDNAIAFAYLDVPASASALGLTVTMLSEANQLDMLKSGVVRVYADGFEPLVLFDAWAEKDRAGTCGDCGEYGRVIGPTDAEVNVTALRGKRAYLTVETRASFFFGANYNALLVDAVTLR